MDKKKEKYEYPIITIIELNDSDFIIATSGDIFAPEYPDDDEPLPGV